MSEQALLFTIGIFTATVAYFAKNFIFDPLLEFKKVKGKIQNRLRYHSNIITNGEFPLEVVEPIRTELRQLSCDLEEKYYAIAFGRQLPTFLRIPTSSMLDQIATNLIFLSNSTGSSRHIDKNDYALNETLAKLGLKHDR